MLSLIAVSVLAFDCCAGSFKADGHGGCYPPRKEGDAFDFKLYSSGMNFTQLSAEPGVEMGAMMLNGLGHWAWTNKTNCVKFPNTQTYPNYCFGAGSSFPHRIDDVKMATGSTVARWKRDASGKQIIYTTPPKDGICHPFVEQGFKIPSIGGADDDSVIYYNVETATTFPENAFTVPDFCPK